MNIFVKYIVIWVGIVMTGLIIYFNVRMPDQFHVYITTCLRCQAEMHSRSNLKNSLWTFLHRFRCPRREEK